MFKAHIKLEVLKQLSQRKLTGYDLMKYFGEVGSKKPSPGYIYPLLSDLKKKEFISVEKDKKKKIYSITQKGKKFLMNLESKQKDMLKRMMAEWKQIADKKEIDEFENIKQMYEKNSLFSQDGALMERLRKAIFSFYEKKNIKKRPEMKKILVDTIKKLEKIK